MRRPRRICRLLHGAAVLALCLSLSGCTWFSSINELIVPPRYTRENALLHDAFEATFDTQVRYKTPVSGEYLSAFVLEDLDGDGAREAMVFFMTAADESVVRIGLMEERGGTWKKTGELEGGGVEIYSVETVDLDADGRTEVVLCWNTQEGSSVMSIYACSFSPFALLKLSEGSYTEKRLLDLDADGQTEILTVTLFAAAGVHTAQARVQRKTENGVTVLDRQDLHSNVTGYGDLFCIPQGNRCLIYIDACIEDGQMITEVIEWDGAYARLSAPLPQDDVETRRGARIACCDVNGDGEPEIPCQHRMLVESEIRQGAGRSDAHPYITTWCVYRSGALTPVLHSLFHDGTQCLFAIPSAWEDRFAVDIYPESGKWNFYEIDAQTKERIGYLFSAVFTTREKWDDDHDDTYAGYTLLHQSQDNCLLVYGVNTESPLPLNETILRDAFTFLT